MKMMIFKCFFIVLCISSLMLSCGSDRRERGTRSSCNKEGKASCNQIKPDKKKRKAREHKRVQTAKIQVQSQSSRSKQDKDLLEEELLVETSFDDSETEAADAGKSEELPESVGDESVGDEVAAAGEDSDEGGSEAEALGVGEEGTEAGSGAEVLGVGEEGTEAGSEAEALGVGEEGTEAGSGAEEDEAAEMEKRVIMETVFSITHAGEEGDEFLVKHQHGEITLDTPGQCVQLLGKQFQGLKIEDGTGWLPVLCGIEGSVCEPGNYDLINDSIPLIWDDYGMEPTEYNDSGDCQKLSTVSPGLSLSE